MIISSCEICKNEYKLRPCLLGIRKFCSKECYWKARKTVHRYQILSESRKKEKINKECLTCNKIYKVIPSREKKSHFCSFSCRMKFYSPKMKRPDRHLEKHWNWKGGRIINDDGYYMIKKPEHPNSSSTGYIREHRFIFEQSIGRLLRTEEEIHHINGNKLDNRLENLKVLSKNDHMRYHMTINNPRKKQHA